MSNKPFCKPCRDKHKCKSNSLMWIPWEQVEIVNDCYSYGGKGAVLVCKVCGHYWYSQSKFARQQSYNIEPPLVLNIKGSK